MCTQIVASAIGNKKNIQKSGFYAYELIKQAN